MCAGVKCEFVLFASMHTDYAQDAGTRRLVRISVTQLVQTDAIVMAHSRGLFSSATLICMFVRFKSLMAKR